MRNVWQWSALSARKRAVDAGLRSNPVGGWPIRKAGRLQRMSLVAALAGLVVAGTSVGACAPSAAEPSGAPAAEQHVASPAKASSASPPAADARSAAESARPVGAAKPAAASSVAARPAARPTENRATDQASAPAGAAAPSVVQTDSGQPAPDLPVVQNLGRRIIYTTEITLLVESLDGFPTAAANLALAHGGYVAGVETGEQGGIPTVIVRLKVPPSHYEAVMRGVRGLALEARDEKATTQDVTEEYDDVQTQIASLEATHAQLLTLMERSGSVEELLKVQQQAADVKLKIDRLKGRAAALERLSDFATITARAQLASVVLQRDFLTVRSSLRQAEATQASLQVQLQRVRAPEEEARLRDRLAEVLLQIARLQSRVEEIVAQAARAEVALPTSEVLAQAILTDETLPQQYIETRVALRRARHEQALLTTALQNGAADGETAARLTAAILRVSELEGRLRTIQERAQQAGVVLPPLTEAQEVALAGLSTPAPGLAIPAPVRQAWDASLAFLVTLVSGVVFLWWTLPFVAVGVYLARRRAFARPRAQRPAVGG